MSEVSSSDGVVSLTPLRPQDADAHLAGEDDQLVRWLNGGPGTLARVEAHIRRCQEQWATGGPLRTFGIRLDAHDSVLIGTIDVRFTLPVLVSGQVNFAYGLYPAWRGQGFATRAVGLSCRYAASEGSVEGVIRVDPDNAASAAVARRSGFEFDRHVQEPDGDRHDWYLRQLRHGAADQHCGPTTVTELPCPS